MQGDPELANQGVVILSHARTQVDSMQSIIRSQIAAAASQNKSRQFRACQQNVEMQLAQLKNASELLVKAGQQMERIRDYLTQLTHS